MCNNGRNMVLEFKEKNNNDAETWDAESNDLTY